MVVVVVVVVVIVIYRLHYFILLKHPPTDITYRHFEFEIVRSP
jgi:hypothetical protein